MKKPETSKV